MGDVGDRFYFMIGNALKKIFLNLTVSMKKISKEVPVLSYYFLPIPKILRAARSWYSYDCLVNVLYWLVLVERVVSEVSSIL